MQRRWLASAATSGDSVLSEARGALRIVTLNRPKALNALDQPMVQTLGELYGGFMRDAACAAVLLRGAGARAFCAGGDVVGVYHAGQLALRSRPHAHSGRREHALPSAFFRDEYRADLAIATLNKPTVALLDGVVMGGGVGVSVHGTHRVATERSLFAMPETAIGLFPDVGGAFFLPRLPLPQLGWHLALTGMRLKGAALKSAGVATHAVPSDQLDALTDALAGVSSATDVAGTLAQFDTLPAEPAIDDPTRVKLLAMFEGHDDGTLTFAEYWDRVNRMAADGDAFAAETRDTLRKMSPTSVRVTFEQLRRGTKLNSLAEALDMEFCLVQHALRNHDFYEGVRALLVDKDKNPKWQPAALEDVDEDMVQRYFQPEDDFEQLKLPSKL